MGRIIRQDGEWHASKGYTLVELMIVLFLVVLIAGMGVIAMMSRLPAARLDATVRELSAMMRQARTLARIHMVKQTLVVDLDAGRYGIDGKPSRQIPEKVLLRFDNPLTGDRDKGIHRLVFQPFGGIDGGTIVLTAGERLVVIKPDPVTGYLIIHGKKS